MPLYEIMIEEDRAPVQADKKDVVDISLYPGENDSQRAVAALKATVPGADKWTWEQQCEQAFLMRERGRFVNLSR